MPPPLFKLCLLLSKRLCTRDPLSVVRDSVLYGVDCVQLREKEMSSYEMFSWGKTLKNLTDELRIPLIINDNVEVAVALGAQGVHLGQGDMSPIDARSLVGDDFWIGLSTHNLAQVDEAKQLGVDYLGFGPLFSTTTKDYAEGLGVNLLSQALAMSTVPLVAIGGIGPENLSLIPAGCPIAVSSAICSNPNGFFAL